MSSSVEVIGSVIETRGGPCDRSRWVAVSVEEGKGVSVAPHDVVIRSERGGEIYLTAADVMGAKVNQGGAAMLDPGDLLVLGDYADAFRKGAEQVAAEFRRVS